MPGSGFSAVLKALHFLQHLLPLVSPLPSLGKGLRVGDPDPTGFYPGARTYPEWAPDLTLLQTEHARSPHPHQGPKHLCRTSVQDTSPAAATLLGTLGIPGALHCGSD